MTPPQPAIFLRKTWAMIESSPPHIAAWSPDGASFVVKTPKDFAATMLPKYFRHNNFHSFVRQLNFYGFRKARTEGPVDAKNAWEFHHEFFHRHAPHLLAKIRRKASSSALDEDPRHGATCTQTPETTDLRAEVQSIRVQMAQLEDQVTYLTRLLNDHGSLDHDRHLYEPYPYPYQSSLKLEYE